MKKSFVMYQDWKPLIDSMTDEQAGKLIKTIYAYQNKQEYELKDALLLGIFNMIKTRFDVDAEAYEQKCEMLRANGRKGGAPKGNQNARKQPIDNLEQPKTTKNNQKETEPKEKKSTYGEHKHVRLTATEYDRLIADYGEQETADAIQFFDDYIEDKGYKSKSHNMAMRRWVFDAVKERKAKVRPISNKFNSMMQNSYSSSEMSELERQLLDN